MFFFFVDLKVPCLTKTCIFSKILNGIVGYLRDKRLQTLRGLTLFCFNLPNDVYLQYSSVMIKQHGTTKFSCKVFLLLVYSPRKQCLRIYWDDHCKKYFSICFSGQLKGVNYMIYFQRRGQSLNKLCSLMESHCSDLCKKWKPSNPPRGGQTFSNWIIRILLLKRSSQGSSLTMFLLPSL